MKWWHCSTIIWFTSSLLPATEKLPREALCSTLVNRQTSGSGWHLTNTPSNHLHTVDCDQSVCFQLLRTAVASSLFCTHRSSSSSSGWPLLPPSSPPPFSLLSFLALSFSLFIFLLLFHLSLFFVCFVLFSFSFFLSFFLHSSKPMRNDYSCNTTLLVFCS